MRSEGGREPVITRMDPSELSHFPRPSMVHFEGFLAFTALGTFDLVEFEVSSHVCAGDHCQELRENYADPMNIREVINELIDFGSYSMFPDKIVSIHNLTIQRGASDQLCQNKK